MRIIVTLFIIAFFLTETTFASEKKWMQRDLRLTTAQSREIKEILKKYSAEIERLRKDVELSKKNLRIDFRSLKKGRLKDKELMMKFEDYRVLKTKYQRLRFMMALEIREKLTDSQLEILHSVSEVVNEHSN